MLCYVLKICNVYVQADEAKIRAELHFGEGGVVQRSLQRKKDSGDSGK